MGFADYYFKRFESDTPQINAEPQNALGIVCVIPVFNEPDILSCLNSLLQCKATKKPIEIIVVVNQSETAEKMHTARNERSYQEALGFSKKFSGNKNCYVLYYKSLPKKHAGVGLARKKGMDEALHRFNKLSNPKGIICCTDADCTLNPDYFTALESHFENFPKTNGLAIHYEHPLDTPELKPENKQRIISYELHLRYLNQAQRYIKLPFAFHTVGSSFAVSAQSYAKQGGMNKKKAGEDFYFLQKIIASGNFYDLPQTTVYPSARSSDRVPFGTGAAIKKMREQQTEQYHSYDLQSFFEIADFLNSRHQLFGKQTELNQFSNCVNHFLNQESFAHDLEHINSISPDTDTFEKHFFAKFNAFKMVKYLNFAQRNFYPSKDCYSQAAKLFKIIAPNVPFNNEEELLAAYRNFEINNPIRPKKI